jgi:hypothetical protein
VSEETLKILDDGPARARMLQDLEEVRSKLGKGGATSNVADEVMPFLARS